MDTIAEALEQIHLSEEARSTEGRNLFLARAQALATLALTEQLERIADKLPDKELSNSKRVVITLNDDTSKEVIDQLTENLEEYFSFHGIVGVIVFENNL